MRSETLVSAMEVSVDLLLVMYNALAWLTADR